MTPSGQTICLCMIVKDEAPVIARCLASVRALVDHWIVVDTGSGDETRDIVRAAMAGLPGELVERRWVDFGHNRSEALELARAHADYSLVIDADDVFEVPGDFAMPVLVAQSYLVDIEDSSLRYQRTQLVANALPWRYIGVLHEYPFCDEARSVGHLPLVMRRNHDGRRRRDPATYRNDAAILARALEVECDPFLVARYTFYLAQSWRDCGEGEKALDAYLARADLGYWDQEVFVSLLQAGRLMEALGRELDETFAIYARATATCQGRAEAAHAASRLCRFNGRNERGRELARPCLDLAVPADGLFVEPWIYQYGLRDEFSVNAYWSHRYDEALDQALHALECATIPGHERKRILANARFASERLTKGETAWPPDAQVLSPRRALHTRFPARAPRVLISILAKQKAPVLPFFLACIEALDYPKDRIVLYVRSNNNTDRTPEILKDWIARCGSLYSDVDYDESDLPTRVEGMAVHDWNATRLRMIRAIRDASLAKVDEHGCDFILAIDVDNFVVPSTLRELVALDLPIVAPLVREALDASRYANYHAKIDGNGYYLETPRYDEILHRRLTGLFELPVVHCTYLVRADVVPKLSYNDGSERFDYVIFSERARQRGIPQYLDNRQLYGYLTLHDDVPVTVAKQLVTISAWFDSEGLEGASFGI